MVDEISVFLKYRGRGAAKTRKKAIFAPLLGRFCSSQVMVGQSGSLAVSPISPQSHGERRGICLKLRELSGSVAFMGDRRD